jgi:hypothetical protein
LKRYGAGYKPAPAMGHFYDDDGGIRLTPIPPYA